MTAGPPTLKRNTSQSAYSAGAGRGLALAARLGPEGLYRLLDSGGAGPEVVHHYDGILTPYGSEGFTVVFGAPVAQEDHARRAVLAALELHQRLGQHPALQTTPGGVLAVRMGLHSGLVVVGGSGRTHSGSPQWWAPPVQLAGGSSNRRPPGRCS